MATTEAQKRANKKWIEKNREKASRTRNKSSAKSFVRNHATIKELEELKILIEERLKNEAIL